MEAAKKIPNAPPPFREELFFCGFPNICLLILSIVCILSIDTSIVHITFVTMNIHFINNKIIIHCNIVIPYCLDIKSRIDAS